MKRSANHKMARRAVKEAASTGFHSRQVKMPMTERLVRKPRDQRILLILAKLELTPSASVSDLAQHVDLSKSRIEHLFKHDTGKTLKSFLCSYRLLCAAVLLAHTNLRIKEIAARTGYSCGQSLARSFGEFCGLGPRLFRQRTFGVRARHQVRYASRTQRKSLSRRAAFRVTK